MSSKILLLFIVAILALPEYSEAALFGRGGLFRSRGGLFSGGARRRSLLGRRSSRRSGRRSVSRGRNRGRGQVSRNRVHGNGNGFNSRLDTDLLFGSLGGRRRDQDEAVFDPGVGLTGRPLAFGEDLSVITGDELSFVGNNRVRSEPSADPNDPCGIRFSNRRNFGNSVAVQGFYFDRRTNRCELGARGQGSNPFPFRSLEECESVVRSGGCSIDSGRFESNQVVFRRR